MPNIFSFQALTIALYYIVPGLVATKVHDLVIPSERRNWGELLFALISYSMFNLVMYILLSPLINWIIPVDNISSVISSTPVDYRSTLIISFILPSVIGFVSATLPKSKRFRSLFRGVILHPMPTSWDYIFGNVTKTYFIVFHLKNGSKVGGYYSTLSYTSAHPGPQDIYIQEVWQISETGPWIKTDRTCGAYIRMENCDYIEFLAMGPTMDIEQKLESKPKLIFRWVNNNLIHSSNALENFT